MLIAAADHPWLRRHPPRVPRRRNQITSKNCWPNQDPIGILATVPTQAFATSMRGSLALIALLVVPFAAQANDVRPTVAWDTSGLGISTYKRLDALNLERRAVLRLVEDGFAVVALAAAPRVTIRLKDAADGVLLEVSGELGTRRHSLALDGSALAELHLEIMQRCVSMAKAVLGPTVGRAPKPPAEPAEPRSAFSVDVSIVGGGVWRSKSFDPTLSAHFGMSITRFLGLHLKGGVAWSTGVQLAIQDWHALLGPRGEFHLSASWKLELAVLGGARVHVAQIAPPLEGSGTRIDAMGAILLRARRELEWGLGIEAGVCGGISPAISHRLGSTTLWERGLMSLEATIGLGWRI